MTQMHEALAALGEKLNQLAEVWGPNYLVKGAVVMERGTLWLKKRNDGWGFMWEESGSKPINLTSASVEARLDAVHALPDLQRELVRARTQRAGDIEEAHGILDKLIAETSQ